jgi:hypothetical protein
VRGFDQKIPLHHKLANLRMKFVDVRNAHLFWSCTSARKCRRHVLYRRAFPCANLLIKSKDAVIALILINFGKSGGGNDRTTALAIYATITHLRLGWGRSTLPKRKFVHVAAKGKKKANTTLIFVKFTVWSYQ